MLKIYHNPRCKKSRDGLAYLKRKAMGFEIVQYLKVGITPNEIKEILSKSGLKAQELLRTQEEAYKSGLKGKDLSEEEILNAICANPKLLQRPIIVKGDKAVLGQPAENIDKVFE